jgi:hypothetical protein
MLPPEKLLTEAEIVSKALPSLGDKPTAKATGDADKPAQPEKPVELSVEEAKVRDA